ncbi:hypothetical protein FBALC1_07968 [Flavobacteriales bacterium ALC-1]|nr:hypothetical protein FBALC1_07968 [Flavobacteriales bacterium ALC-1]
MEKKQLKLYRTTCKNAFYIKRYVQAEET